MKSGCYSFPWYQSISQCCRTGRTRVWNSTSHEQALSSSEHSTSRWDSGIIDPTIVRHIYSRIKRLIRIEPARSESCGVSKVRRF